MVIGQRPPMCQLGMRLGIVRVIFFAVAAAFATVSRVNGQTVTYDLTADWSGINNPNGAWRLYKAPGQLFLTSQSDYWGDATNQIAWANDPLPGTAHVPVWMKATSSNATLAGFASVGTVIMHTAETARTGTEFSSVTWTSPGAGNAVVTGGAWVQKDSDRPQVWEILVNGVSVTGGPLTLGEAYNQSAPFDFISGSGGSSALHVPVSTNDVIELLFHRQSSATPGTLVGMTFAVAFTAIPEPPSSAVVVSLLALAVPKLAARVRRRRV
jgi:hypothetical protein